MGYQLIRAVDPASFFADSDPAFFFNPDSDLAAVSVRIRIQLNNIEKNYLMKT